MNMRDQTKTTFICHETQKTTNCIYVNKVSSAEFCSSLSIRHSRDLTLTWGTLLHCYFCICGSDISCQRLQRNNFTSAAADSRYISLIHAGTFAVQVPLEVPEASKCAKCLKRGGVKGERPSCHGPVRPAAGSWLVDGCTVGGLASLRQVEPETGSCGCEEIVSLPWRRQFLFGKLSLCASPPSLVVKQMNFRLLQLINIKNMNNYGTNHVNANAN